MSDARSTRRTFLTGVAAMGLAGRTLLRSGDAAAAVHAAKKAAGSATALPDPGHRPLGRTGFTGSRLVFGCGAALARRRRDELLEAADLVTEMTMVKHPFRNGVKAQRGIEF